MNKLSKINKWYILTVALLATVFFSSETLLEVVTRDATGITTGIIAIFVLCHLAVARLIAKPSERLETTIAFIAEFMVALGLIGTVTGFMILFGDSFINLHVSDQASIAAVISDVAAGLGTALVTTLFGLVSRWAIIAELHFLYED